MYADGPGWVMRFGRMAGRCVWSSQTMTLSHPGLSAFHLEPTTAPLAALFLNCPPTIRPGHRRTQQQLKIDTLDSNDLFDHCRHSSQPICSEHS